MVVLDATTPGRRVPNVPILISEERLSAERQITICRLIAKTTALVLISRHIRTLAKRRSTGIAWRRLPLPKTRSSSARSR